MPPTRSLRPLVLISLLAACAPPSGAGRGRGASLARTRVGDAPGEVPWRVASGQDYANLGTSVASAGDVNGDGYDDVILGAPGFADGEVSEGRAFVYLGSDSGLPDLPAWTAESDSATSIFGQSVSSAGDVNGDGYYDVIVGAPFFPGRQDLFGRAYVYLGGADGLSPDAVWIVDGDQRSSAFGWSVSGAGDVNGDGYGDVIVGAPERRNTAHPDGEDNVGRVYVYLGSSGGLSTTAAWTLDAPTLEAHPGHSVAAAGDVDGDGFDDVAVGFAPRRSNPPAAAVYMGSADGLSPVAAWGAEPPGRNQNFHVQVRSAGDVNGDGFADLVVGVDSYFNLPGSEQSVHDGHADVFLGSASGLSPVAAWTLPSDDQNATVGRAVGSAGDVNDDGYSDLLVGVPYASNPELDEGQARLFLGSANGLGGAPSWTAESDIEAAFFANAVASAGDVNGDGRDDVLVGDQWYSHDQPDEGAAYVYLWTGGPADDTDADTDASDTDAPDADDTDLAAPPPQRDCGCSAPTRTVAVSPVFLLILTVARRRGRTVKG